MKRLELIETTGRRCPNRHAGVTFRHLREVGGRLLATWYLCEECRAAGKGSGRNWPISVAAALEAMASEGRGLSRPVVLDTAPAPRLEIYSLLGKIGKGELVRVLTKDAGELSFKITEPVDLEKPEAGSRLMLTGLAHYDKEERPARIFLDADCNSGESIEILAIGELEL